MKRAFLGLAFSFLAVVVACSDDPATEPAQTSPITQTTPDAGADAAVATLPASGILAATTSATLDVNAQRTVALHASVGGGAGPYHLAWSQTSGPHVELTGDATLDPTFVAPNVAASTDLAFSLLVVDATGTIVGATTTVTVAPNALEVATATTLRVGDVQTVTLNAVPRGSLDGATFFWRQIGEAPALIITNAATANASVAIPALTAETTYHFELLIENRDGATTKTVTIDVLPASLLATGAAVFDASAGVATLFATSGTTVALNGSTKNPKATASYTWTQTGGTPVVISSNAAVANPTFTAPTVTADTDLVFHLSATDGVSTATSDVTVTVKALTAFAANAAGDQAAAAGAATYLGGAAVGGTGPYRWTWTQKSGTAATIANGETPNPIVTLPYVAADETATFTLTATDAAGKTSSDDVAVAVKAPTQSANGPSSSGVAYRPLTDRERTVYTCTGLDCFTRGTQIVCDERTPFALTTVTTLGTGKITIMKTCASGTACLTNWIKNTKPLDLCTSLLPPTSAGADTLANNGSAVACSYCCLGESCNKGIIPDPTTIAACPGDVCFPAK